MATTFPPLPPHRPRGSARRSFLLGFVIVLIIAIVGIVIRVHDERSLKKETSENAVPVVAVIDATQGPAVEEIVLPGTISPWHEATLYARTNGYLKDWVRTMGMHVKKGELIATIETPEVDAQLRQAEADLKTAEANNALSQSTAARWKKLLKTDSVSKQEADEKTGDALAKAATLNAAAANRDHLKDLESFKEVRAPFDGVITSRTTDIGALINSGSDTQQPLFHIVQADYLRVYVRVPQAYAPQIKPDMVAQLQFDEHPGKLYPASFVTTAEAIDATNQTMLVEFKVDNRDYELLAGGYTQVHLKLPSVATTLRIPVNTLLFRAEGPRVAVVDADNHAQLKAITIGRDFGNQVEIVAGLEPHDQVIVNPADSLISGQEVRIAKPEEKKDGDTKDAKAEDKKDEKK